MAKGRGARGIRRPMVDDDDRISALEREIEGCRRDVKSLMIIVLIVTVLSVASWATPHHCETANDVRAYAPPWPAP